MELNGKNLFRINVFCIVLSVNVLYLFWKISSWILNSFIYLEFENLSNSKKFKTIYYFTSIFYSISIMGIVTAISILESAYLQFDVNAEQYGHVYFLFCFGKCFFVCFLFVFIFFYCRETKKAKESLLGFFPDDSLFFQTRWLPKRQSLHVFYSQNLSMPFWTS